MAPATFGIISGCGAETSSNASNVRAQNLATLPKCYSPILLWSFVADTPQMCWLRTDLMVILPGAQLASRKFITTHDLVVLVPPEKKKNRGIWARNQGPRTHESLAKLGFWCQAIQFLRSLPQICKNQKFENDAWNMSTPIISTIPNCGFVVGLATWYNILSHWHLTVTYNSLFPCYITPRQGTWNSRVVLKGDTQRQI